MCQMRVHGTLLEKGQRAISVQGMPNKDHPEKRDGHAQIKTPVPLLVHSHAPVNGNEKEFFGQRNPEAAGSQALPPDMAYGAQAAPINGQKGRGIYSCRQD